MTVQPVVDEVELLLRGEWDDRLLQEAAIKVGVEVPNVDPTANNFC
jgi:hypothetical protein